MLHTLTEKNKQIMIQVLLQHSCECYKKVVERGSCLVSSRLVLGLKYRSLPFHSIERTNTSLLIYPQRVFLHVKDSIG